MRRNVLSLRCVLATFLTIAADTAPNMVVLLFDDFGWGDASFNDPSVQETPNMAALANSSKVFSDFHSGASVCTPARAALLTGRYGLRTGIYHNFSPTSIGGLPAGEITLPQLLKDTHESHMIGKWHLGHHDAFSPTIRGFQSWLGLPFSGDMGCLDHTPLSCKGYEDRSSRSPSCPPQCPADDEASSDAGVPLYNSTSTNCSGKAFAGGCNGDIVEQPVDEFTLNRRYTERIVDFIGSRAQDGPEAKPFLLYVGFAHTHSPLSYDTAFENVSVRPGWKSVFGNVLAELDHAVGRIVAALDDAGLREDTLLIVTSDNGPADSSSQDCDFLGSAGPFVGEWQRQNGGTHTATMKFNTWEGGHRVPGLFSWPGRIKPGRTDALGSLMDLVPTFAALAGVTLPTDRVFDGKDLSSVLFSDLVDWPTPRALFHPDNKDGSLTAGRLGQYKFFTKTQGSTPCFVHSEGRTPPARNEARDSQLGSVRFWGKTPLVFDLSVDPSEAVPVNASADIVAQYLQALEETQQSIADTLKHIADWSANGTAAWPCCNPGSSSCRCAASTQVV